MFDSQGWQGVLDATLCIGCSLMAVDNVLSAGTLVSSN